MYGDICGHGYDPNITFKDAYEVLEVVYGDLQERRNRYLKKQNDDYECAFQIRIEGPGEGTFFVRFTKEGMEMAPYDYKEADAFIAASFDNLYNIAVGQVSADKLFVNGQLKVEGNISKGAELRYLLGKEKY